MLTPLLDDSVWTVRATATLVVAFINGHSRWQADSLFGVVSKLRTSTAATASRLLLDTVGAFTSDDRILLQKDALTGNVVIDIGEIL